RFGQIHPRQPSRPASPAKARHGRNADPTRQHPWSALLQLGEINLLKHPTLDQLHALGLHVWPRPSPKLRPAVRPTVLAITNGWGSCLIAKHHGDRTNASRRDWVSPNCANRPASKNVDYRNPRGLDRALFQKLVEGEWINAHDNLALIGPTGVGKSWLASALGHKACRGSCGLNRSAGVARGH